MTDPARSARDNRSDLERFVELAFRGVLRRDPTQGDIDQFAESIRSGQSHIEILSGLIESPEYASMRVRGHYDPDTDDRLSASLSTEAVATSARLEACDEVSLARYEDEWSRIFERDGIRDDQREYGEYHKRRFFELVSAIAVLTGDQPAPRVLEIGVSEFTILLKRILPQLHLSVADRPMNDAQIGYYGELCSRAAIESSFHVDLNNPDFLTDEAVQSIGGFDLLLCTEVLEHLLVHPVDLLMQLARLLKPGGSLYLTTPNFFSHYRLQQIADRENPQEVLPRSGRNVDCQHHHREFCMVELLKYFEESGLDVAGFLFSSCWDPQDATSRRIPRDQMSNLVIVGRRRDPSFAT